MRVKHLGQEFMPIKRLFRSVLIRNEKSACLQMSLGNVVGFVPRLLDDHGHSGSELPAMPLLAQPVDGSGVSGSTGRGRSQALEMRQTCD